MKTYQFSQQGKRSNNEDGAGQSVALFTVCDGMGGHNFGERASAFVVEQMLKRNEALKSLSKTDIQQQLNEVQLSLNRLLEAEPELEKMGTTFTGIFLTPDVWYAAHVGDSRIYLIRAKEQKLWHTWDHSLVGELMRTHEITTEAGRFHPLSNRISKAIIAQTNGKPTAASVVKIDNLQEDDILLLCSDGVVEAWGDYDLVQLFTDNALNFEQKCERLAQQCNEISNDNNTAIVLQIEKEDEIAYGDDSELDWTTFDEIETDYQQYLKEIAGEEIEGEDVEGDVSNENDEQIDDVSQTENSHTRLFWCGIIALIVVLTIVFVLWLKPHKPVLPVAPQEIEIQQSSPIEPDIPKIIPQGNDPTEEKQKETEIPDSEQPKLKNTEPNQGK